VGIGNAVKVRVGGVWKVEGGGATALADFLNHLYYSTNVLVIKVFTSILRTRIRSSAAAGGMAALIFTLILFRNVQEPEKLQILIY